MLIHDAYRIVVGHDLEHTGDEALREAIALAQRVSGAEAHVVHVIAEPSSRDLDRNEQRLDRAMIDLRRRTSDAAIAAEYAGPMRLHVRFGEVAPTIHQIAVDYDASLVLVGTHGRSGLDRMRHGSTAQRLVRNARLPVLVAHAKDFKGLAESVRPDQALPGAELHGDQAISEVLIPRRSVTHISGLV